MNINLPKSEGAKKKQMYWNVCIVFGILAIIFIGISGSSSDSGSYRYGHGTNNWDWVYECDDGEIIRGEGTTNPDGSLEYADSIENDGKEDCDDGSDEIDGDSPIYSMLGSSTCCFSVIFAISALSTRTDDQRVVIIQQQPQYVPVAQPQYIPAPQVRTPIQPPPIQQIAPSVPTGPGKAKQTWIKEARNLELARNWEGAAEAYQKAEMFAEAGRIRQEHLEQNQPVVQIGQVGNTVLNDSVMIADSAHKTCPGCGNTADPSWNICPHCPNQL